MLAPLSSGPPDPLSDFIIRNNLVPLLWHSLAVGAIMKARKIGSALSKALMEGLECFEKVQGRFCDCWTRCSSNWRRCKELRSQARPPEKVKALARRAGAG